MQDPSELWRLIPAADFTAPLPPANDAASGGVWRVWKWLRGLFAASQNKSKNAAPVGARPTAELLQAIHLDTNWKRLAQPLARDVGEDWFEQKRPERRLQIFVGAPGCSFGHVLQTLARERRLQVLTHPSPDTILRAAQRTVSELAPVSPSVVEPVVISNLEHWFFRHQEGLSVVRTLVDRLSGSNTRALIGCDSWAWAFLQAAIGIEDILGEPRVLAPFDAERLDLLLREFLNLQEFEFRQSGSDEPVFPAPSPSDRENKQQSQVRVPELIRKLAARARGNPAVALALWRNSLRTHSDDTDKSPTIKSTRSVLWVEPPSELTLPQLPMGIDRVHRYLLHSLLIHGGLRWSLLLTLLPFPADELQRRVAELLGANILEVNDETLNVSLAAYSLVRRDLQGAEFIIDAL